MYKKVPGTKDILPDECAQWQAIEQTSREIFRLYNYREIRVPVIEEAALFDRSLGQSSEIVQKQMFLIKNKEDLYALRPEGTAAIVRAYIENSLDKTQGFAKFYYLGPMFRLERPQKGRLRQFHHIGCEVIGSYAPEIDVEVIRLAGALLDAYSIQGYKIQINSLGCVKDKKALSDILHKKLKDKKSGLCPDCQDRLNRNVLRILDCKDESCKKIVQGLNIGAEYLCADCQGHFDQVKSGLDGLGVKYEVSPHLVRGLDYYTRTVFEIKHDGLGAQDAIGAGGRYDNLIKELGGPDTGAIGFAFGVERLLLAGEKPQTVNNNLVYVISLGQEAKKEAAKLLNILRANGIACDTDYEGKSLKAAMRKANDLNAKFVLMLGDNELKSQSVSLKNMQTGEQKEIKQSDLIPELKC